MHTRPLVPVFAAVDVALAVSQTSIGMPWYKWLGLALAIITLALSLLDAYRGKQLALPLALAASSAALTSVLDFVHSSRRAVDDVSVAVMCATAVLAWRLFARGRRTDS